MGKIIIVGLGAGDISQLPMGVYEQLHSDKPIYLRTALHPVVEALTKEGLTAESFDALYDTQDQFDSVYETVVARLLIAAESQDIIYAVPGHPMVAEKTVQLLLKEQNKCPVEIFGGHSFLDDLFTAVKMDPIEGFQLVDALSLDIDQVQMSQHLIVMQVFDGFVASDVKLILSEKYPDDYQVALVHEAGSKSEVVEWMPLYEIDRMEGIRNLTSLFVPQAPIEKRSKEFTTLQHYIDEIAQKDLWVQEQTSHSLLPFLKDETAEFMEAVEKDDIENMVEELGDILMLILYHASVGEKEGVFCFEDILNTLNQKLYRRHPNVFGDVKVDNVEDLILMWQKIKEAEKEGRK